MRSDFFKEIREMCNRRSDMNRHLYYIKEYFNTFSNNDYTIYVDGNPTEKCELNDYDNYIVWRPLDNNELVCHFISIRDIEAIKQTPTTMEIKKTNGKEYKLVAKLKIKEEKAKEILFKAKMALHAHNINHALGYLDELSTLTDE